MQLIQLQAGYDNAQVLGEEEESWFEETGSKTDQQTGIKSANQANEIDGKVERTDQNEELAGNSEIESGNNSSGADKGRSTV